MASIIEIQQKIPALYLTWVINNICTNKCSYCHPNLYTGKNHNYEWHHAEKFIDHVLKTYSRINVSISGGEPTLSPWLRDLVKKFSDVGHPVGMTTNGARTVRYYDDIAQFMSYIVMSYHPSFEDLELIEKAYACSKHTITTMSIMFDSRYFDKSLAMYNRLSEEGVISVEPVRIHDWNSGNSFGRDYSPEQIEILESLPRTYAKKAIKPKNIGLTGARAIYDDGTVDESLHAQNLINTKQTDFQNWDCMIGLESLYVKWDGMVRSGNCITSEVLGRIQDFETIRWPRQPWVCRQNFCNCSTDVYVSKRKYRS